MSFNPIDLVDEQDELKTHEIPFTLWPKAWAKYPLRRKLSWSRRELSTANKRHIPKAAGIYTLLIQPGIAGHPSCSYLMYVGKTKDLRDRFYDYCTTEKRVRPKIVRLLHKWHGHIRFCYIRIPPRDLSKVEDALIAAFIPPANSDYPATIRAAKKAF